MKASFIPLLALLSRNALASCDNVPPESDGDEYDYVVIGSGPGGGPLAANLAREGHSVFLIEAGSNRGDDLLQQIPRWYNLNAEHPEMSWQFFVSHYQNQTQAQRDRAFTYRLENGTLYYGLEPPEGATPLGIYYPRGATVGGSAIANAMNVVMPPDQHWNSLAEITGDDSWKAENVRSHYEALERNVYAEPGSPGHGYDGYISVNLNNVSYIVDRPGVLEVVQNAIALTEGIDIPDYDQTIELLNRDLNRADADRYEIPGVYRTPVHIDENRRRSSPWQIISETLAAQNEDGTPRYPLTLSTESLATKVLTREENGEVRAYGVEYLLGEALYEADRRYDPSISGEQKTVMARKEVIVAGGAFNTPQILKLSGIGPRAELEVHNIPVVADLRAVGEYLQDNYEIGIHVNAAIPWENNPLLGCSFNPEGTPETDPCLAQWLEGYGGYGDGAAPIFALYRTEHSDSADTDLIMFGAAGAVFNGHYPNYSTVRWPNTSFFFNAVGMQSHNPLGTVRLRSADPRQTPLIDFNWFSDEEGREQDLAALAQGLEHIVSFVNATGEPYQPFEWIDPPADRSLEQHILDHTFSHHALGSCRMGASAEDSVVDSDFKVHGVAGLRVVDGSVLHQLAGGFPTGATFTLGQAAFAKIMGENA